MSIRSSHQAFLPLLLAVVVTVTMGLSASSRICGDRNVGESPSATTSTAVDGAPVSPCTTDGPCETPSTSQTESAAVEGDGSPTSCCVWRSFVEPAGVLSAAREATDLFGSPSGEELGDDRARTAAREATAVRVRETNAPGPSSLLSARQYTSVFLL